LLDCLYSYYLAAVQLKEVADLGATKCYSDLIERNKLLMTAEVEGITLDVAETKRRLDENAEKLIKLEAQIKEQWAPQFNLWRMLQLQQLELKYQQMAEDYASKRGKDVDSVWPKYEVLLAKAKEKADVEFNLNSPEQLKWLLRDAVGRDITGLDGEEAADKGVLALLSEQYDDVKVLMEYKKHQKLQSTYYPELLEHAKHDGRIHCNFNITGARTGRLSSSALNLQNQPGHVHDLFTAAPGNVLITKDFSAIEPVFIAFYSEDKHLVDIVQSGKSFHSVNAKEIFNLPCEPSKVAELYPKERKAAKEFALSVLYGAGGGRVQQSLKKQGYSFTLDECKRMVYRLRDYYSDVWAFKTEVDSIATSGAVFYNYFGRPLQFKNPDEVFMSSFNSLVQGTASDLLVDAGTKLVSANPWIRPRLFVHDEIVVEVPEDRAREAEELLVKQMTGYELMTKFGNVPITVEGKVSKTWIK
jgi:DNA polymerase-1